MIKILDVDDQIERSSIGMGVGLPLDTAFPKLRDVRSTYSRAHLIHAVNWMWLQAQKSLPHQEIAQVASQIVKRSLAFCAAREREPSRDMHDYVLLNVTILVGDQDLIDEVLGFVSMADENAEQYEIMNLCKGKQPAIRVAAKPVLRSLIANNAKPMPRQIKSVTDFYWKELRRILYRPVLYEDSEIRLGVWDHNRFWPWPEAVAMKLMARRGAKIQADEFWLPQQLVC